MVRLDTDSDDNSSFVLHMKPNSCFVERYGFLDWFDPGLEAGASFTDPEIGMTITTDWTDSSGATVSVSFGPQTCVPANPSVQLSPSESPWVAPGTPVTYSVTVTNNDGAACGTAVFDLSASLPTDWTGSFLDLALSLAPGETGSTTLDVTSPASAADGSYDVLVTAENGADPAYKATGAATYLVSAAVNQPPTAVDDSATTEKDKPVTVAVLINDWDPDGDPLTVTAATAAAKGTVTVNADGTITYEPGPKAKGRDSFSYTVSDGIDVSSAMVTVSVKNQGGGNGGNKPGS